MIDSHCHLSFFSEEQIQKIFEKNYCVKKLINVGTNAKDIPYTKKIDGCTVYNSVGIHPTDVADISMQDAEQYIMQYIDQIIAIGECGIDLHHYQNLNQQLDFLHMHCFLAEKFHKPIIIHSWSVEIEEILHIVKQYKIKVLFHCWSYGYLDLLKAIDLGCYISFSGILTFKKTVDIHESATKCPIDKIMFETDSPFLTPRPLSDKINNPTNVKHIYNFAAHLRNINIDDLIGIVNLNFDKFFFS